MQVRLDEAIVKAIASAKCKASEPKTRAKRKQPPSVAAVEERRQRSSVLARPLLNFEVISRFVYYLLKNFSINSLASSYLRSTADRNAKRKIVMHAAAAALRSLEHGHFCAVRRQLASCSETAYSGTNNDDIQSILESTVCNC